MQRRPAALLPALILALAGSGLAALPAEAATVTDGHCSTDTGVTVVVDHQQLGGGIVIKCVEGYPAGASGLEVLHLAGFAPEGTVHDGSSFVCRIAGRPGPNETIAITSDPEYRENCVSTPPDDAFWGYWHAQNGGKWTFSSLGAGNREAIPGGYEGFSFSLNNSSSNNPPPGVKPAHKVAQPPAPEPTQAPAPTTPAPAKKPTAAPKPSVEPEPKVERPRLPSRTAPPNRPVTPTPTPSPTPTAQSPTPAPTTTSPTATENATATPTPSPTPEPEPSTVPASPTPMGTASAPPVDAVIDDGGPPVGTFIGLGTVAALGLGGGLVWWRRRGL